MHAWTARDEGGWEVGEGTRREVLRSVNCLDCLDVLLTCLMGWPGYQLLRNLILD